jgi:hypothetical protein
MSRHSLVATLLQEAVEPGVPDPAGGERVGVLPYGLELDVFVAADRGRQFRQRYCVVVAIRCEQASLLPHQFGVLRHEGALDPSQAGIAERVERCSPENPESD